MKKRHLGLFLLFVLLTIETQSQVTSTTNLKEINWPVLDSRYQALDTPEQQLPVIYGSVPIDSDSRISTVSFTSENYEPLSDVKKNLYLSKINLDSITIRTEIQTERKIKSLGYSFIPLRLNPITRQPEKLTSYSIQISGIAAHLKSTSERTYTSESLLKSGNWYKIKVDTTGIFKLTYEELKSIGIDKPENVRVYGYGGSQLPFMNNETNYDDLKENPIVMNYGNDAVFNNGDYILFYSQGPVTWKFDQSKELFIHHIHDYSNYIYLFLTSDMGPGLRIQTLDENNKTASYNTSTFDAYACHEKNSYNLVKSGRTWYGERLKSGSPVSFGFDFPNRVANENIKLFTQVAGRTAKNTPVASINVYQGSDLLTSIAISSYYDIYNYAFNYIKNLSFKPTSSSVNLTYDLTGGNSSSEGYLDFICLNTRENLVFNPKGQMGFRDQKSVGESQVTQFEIDNQGKILTIWDVTNPSEPVNMKLVSQGTKTQFKATTDTLRYYIAFDGSSFLSPVISGDDLGQIENQNLHGIDHYQMVIVTHPKFMKYAEEIAEFHRTMDTLSVFITTPQMIYNEFSSGTPDVSAIRNFMRMLYDKANTEEQMPRYLLLFGDGSYDNKNIKSSNSNYILTYQNENGVSETASFVTDDFFGLLDNDEGMHIGALDVGIGRFPVQTEEEAQIMIDKIKHYSSSKSRGDWQSQICFIGDDEDIGIHTIQANDIAGMVNQDHPEYNLDKIYFDAFQQISTPSGQRYPDATKAINDQVAKGALIFDYVGHGNPRLLAHEEVLTVPDVRSWTNYDRLSIFVTASCEVGRYDDYERTSMGEWFILNPNGGSVATLTTTRVVYSGSNDILNTNFFENVFNTNYRLGDIIRVAKNNTNGITDINKRNFSLLGDPALKLAIPLNRVVVTKINGKDIEATTGESELAPYHAPEVMSTTIYDTLTALSTATVHGYLVDSHGNLLDTLNGILYPTIYDKPISITSYGNDKTAPITFKVQNNVLYKGRASVVNGFFDFTFIVPKDINYQIGNGKISLYATFDSIDAIGYTDQLLIGGSAENAEADYNGPTVKLFINDTTFINGGITNENPVLLAQLFDESGINTTGNGIGHNITAILDNNQDNVLNLNNFYQGYLDNYNSGEVIYPFLGLSAGMHTLTFKVWDIYNNSSESEINFNVYGSTTPVIENVYNAPNPFSKSTSFSFTHNQANKYIQVTIRIYGLMGNEVAVLNQSDDNGSFTISPISWNGTSTNGAKLEQGVYIYRVEIKTADGLKTGKSSKLMIFR